MSEIIWEPILRVDQRSPALDDIAFYGPIGEAALALTDDSEVSAISVQATGLALLGNRCCEYCHFRVGADLHYPVLFMMILGSSGRARKSMSTNLAEYFVEQIFPDIKKYRVSGLNSSEGIIARVSDTKVDPAFSNKPNPPMIDRPREEKSLYVIEKEAARLLSVMKREGNTLSQVVRDIWDCSDLEIVNKHSPVKATKPFLSMIMNVTERELKSAIRPIDLYNGFANRITPIFTARGEPFSEGGDFDKVKIKELSQKVKNGFEKSKNLLGQNNRMVFSDSGRRVWKSVYEKYYFKIYAGVLDTLTARSQPTILRIAMVFAFYDGSPEIGEDHILAAEAIWKYSEESWKLVYEDAVGDDVADKILNSLEGSEEPFATKDLHKVFGNNKEGKELNSKLKKLLDLGLIQRGTKKTTGKAAIYYRSIRTLTNLTNYTKKEAELSAQSDDSLISSNSFAVGPEVTQ